jgi:hypothetical protein
MDTGTSIDVLPKLEANWIQIPIPIQIQIQVQIQSSFRFSSESGQVRSVRI